MTIVCIKLYIANSVSLKKSSKHPPDLPPYAESSGESAKDATPHDALILMWTLSKRLALVSVPWRAPKTTDWLHNLIFVCKLCSVSCFREVSIGGLKLLRKIFDFLIL